MLARDPQSARDESERKSSKKERRAKAFTFGAFAIAVGGSVGFLLAGRWALKHSEWLNDLLIQRVFWGLALLPGVIALSNLFFGVLPRRSRRRSEIVGYLAARARVDKPSEKDERSSERQEGLPAGSVKLAAESEERSGPSGKRSEEDEERSEEWESLASPAAIVFGAFVLVAVFGVAAGLSVPTSHQDWRRPLRIGLERAATPTPTSAAVSPAPSASATPTHSPSPTATATATPAAPAPSQSRVKPSASGTRPSATPVATREAAKTPAGIAGASTDSSDPIDRSGGVSEGVVGLVFAAYGAYVYTMTLLIIRINSNGVTGKFLFNSAIRSAVAMVFGYAIGVFGLFAAVTNSKTSLFLYFAVGVFPSWAFDAFRRRARELFQEKETGCEVLPLCLVDGVDDGIIDRLAEAGIWDIQHLASADAPDLVMRTLFPLQRVLDWIDQAVLIKYVKNQIAEFRKQGIRSAIELLAVYGDATKRMETDPTKVKQKGLEDPVVRETRGKAILETLSQKTSFSKDSLYAIGRSLFEDAPLRRIWKYWQNVDPGSGPK